MEVEEPLVPPWLQKILDEAEPGSTAIRHTNNSVVLTGWR
jgi:hypothetical protein